MKNIKTETKYLYEVVESKSPEMPVGKKFWANVKFIKVLMVPSVGHGVTCYECQKKGYCKYCGKFVVWRK